MRNVIRRAHRDKIRRQAILERVKADTVHFREHGLQDRFRLLGWHQPLVDREAIHPRKHVIVQLAIGRLPSCQHSRCRIKEGLEVDRVDAFGIVLVAFGLRRAPGQRLHIGHAQEGSIVRSVGKRIRSLKIVDVEPLLARLIHKTVGVEVRFDSIGYRLHRLQPLVRLRHASDGTDHVPRGDHQVSRGLSRGLPLWRIHIHIGHHVTACALEILIHRRADQRHRRNAILEVWRPHRLLCIEQHRQPAVDAHHAVAHHASVLPPLRHVQRVLGETFHSRFTAQQRRQRFNGLDSEMQRRMPSSRPDLIQSVFACGLLRSDIDIVRGRRKQRRRPAVKRRRVARACDVDGSKIRCSQVGRQTHVIQQLRGMTNECRRRLVRCKLESE